MTIALWCVLIALIYPYLFTILAKSAGGFDNHHPRAYLSQLTGWHQRANAVQMNSFEVHPGFGIAVIIATMLHANPLYTDRLAILFIVSRILYGLCYLTDAALLRTLCFFVGWGVIIGLFYISA